MRCCSDRRAASERLTRRALLATGVPLVVFTGAGLTDPLLIVSGLASFIVAPLWCWMRHRSRAWLHVSAYALTTGVLSALMALLLSRVMRDQHVIHAAFPINFVTSGDLAGSVQNMIGALASLGGGDFFGASASGANLLTFIAGALTFLALAVVLRTLWRWAGSAGTTDREPPPSGPRELFLAFWGSMLVLGLAVFVLTSLSAEAANYRYLLGAWVALAALLGILCTTGVHAVSRDRRRGRVRRAEPARGARARRGEVRCRPEPADRGSDLSLRESPRGEHRLHGLLGCGTRHVGGPSPRQGLPAGTVQGAVTLVQVRRDPRSAAGTRRARTPRRS